MTPRWWPRRIYYGWALVWALGLTATVSYGILSYAFAVFILPMGVELGWSKAAITGGFSVAQLVAGLAAVPVGRWVDRHGARGVMTAGSVLAVVVLVAWSEVRTLPVFYLLCTLLGLAMAAVLYEPAFAVVAVWFRKGRGRALTVLTFLGGFASVVFVPLATLLVERLGWRGALLALAGFQAVLTLPPHALLLRRHPADLGLAADGEGAAWPATPSPPATSARDIVRSGSFRWLAVTFALSAFGTTAIAVHLVPLLLERGYDAAFAGAAMGLLGLMALPGRLVFTPLGDRWPRPAVTAVIFLLQAMALGIFLVGGRGAWGTAAIWSFVVLFGAGFGAITPARAALVADLYGAERYGAVGGALAMAVSLARAAAPVGASLLYALGGLTLGYDIVLGVLLVLCLGSAWAVVVAGRGSGGSAAGAVVRGAGLIREQRPGLPIRRAHVSVRSFRGCAESGGGPPVPDAVPSRPAFHVRRSEPAAVQARLSDRARPDTREWP